MARRRRLARAGEIHLRGALTLDRAHFRLGATASAADTAANSDEGFNAIGQAKSGRAWYAKRGFRTTAAHPAGVGHDLSGRFGAVIAGVLDRNKRT